MSAQMITRRAAEICALVYCTGTVAIVYFWTFGFEPIETPVWQTANRPSDAIGFFYLPVLIFIVVGYVSALRIRRVGMPRFVYPAAFLAASCTTVVLFLCCERIYPSVFLVLPLLYLAVTREAGFEQTT